MSYRPKLRLDSRVLWQEQGDNAESLWFLVFYDWFITQGLLAIDSTRLRDKTYVIFREKFSDEGQDYWDSVLERFRARKIGTAIPSSIRWLESDYRKWSKKRGARESADAPITPELVALVINTYALVLISFNSSDDQWIDQQRKILKKYARAVERQVGSLELRSSIDAFWDEAEALLSGEGGDEEDVGTRYEEMINSPEFRMVAQDIRIPCLLEHKSETLAQIRKLSEELIEPNPSP